MIGGFRSILCVSVFQGSLLVNVIMIDGSEKRNCEGGLTVRMFLKSTVKDHKFCCSYDCLVTTSCRPIRSVITVMKQIRLSPHGHPILFYHSYD